MSNLPLEKEMGTVSFLVSPAVDHHDWITCVGTYLL